jgi:4-carboxymuconolactone decarboxylase
MDEKQRNENGTAMRRKVLGDAYVDRTLKNVTSFNEEFQDMITRHAWGEIWTRPGLPLHQRSLITIAMLIALKQTDELRLHLRGALNNGVTRDEIKEVLMQSAIYCGVPAANSAFHVARDVFAEIDSGK